MWSGRLKFWKEFTYPPYDFLFSDFPFVQREDPSLHLTIRWQPQKTKPRQNIKRTPPKPTTNLPKFKFLHNIVHVNTHFFLKTPHPFFHKQLCVTLPTDVKQPNWKTSFCFMKTFKGKIFLFKFRKKKNHCYKVNRYSPRQPNLVIRKFNWEVEVLYSIICSLWFKALATSTSHVTAPSTGLTL